MAKITAVDGNVKVEDATVEETITPVEDVVVEPEETIDSDFSVDNTEESYDEDVMPLPSGEEDATPVYNGDVAQQSSETIGKKWNEYTTGTDLDDTDELIILDTSAKANKRTLLSKLSDYVLGKLADKVFKKLETQNKTILGALNELNSKALPRKIFTDDNTETDILNWCEELLAKSTLEVYFVFASDLSDKPLSRKYRYSPGLFFHTYDTCVLMFYCYNTREIAIRSKYRNGEWSDWRVI